MASTSSCNRFNPVKFNSAALDTHVKIVVLNVHDALVHEDPTCTVRSLVSKCANMTGVGETTIYKLLKQRKNGLIMEPAKKPPGKKPIEIDDTVKRAIRSKVHSFYLNKQIPTIDKVLSAINDDEDLPTIRRTKLWKILHELNFVWTKHDRRSVLTEKDEIVCWRRQYLREIRTLRAAGKTIFYLDETWLNEAHIVSKVWQDKTIKNSRQAWLQGLSTGLTVPIGKGRRLIITHIGSDQGFVDGGLLEFVSKSTKDYHEEMNSDVFEEYFSQMLDLIPTNSVIVLDNASYHSRLKEPLPTAKWKKQCIHNWLTEKGIPINNDMLKKELLMVARQHKSGFKKYVIDEMAKDRGISVLRLPPYHCEFNPIELIWSQMKGYVARKNTTFKLNDVRQLLLESISTITKENWQKAVEHAIKEEQKMWRVDNMIEETVEPMIIPLQTDDESSDDDLDTD